MVVQRTHTVGRFFTTLMSTTIWIKTVAKWISIQTPNTTRVRLTPQPSQRTFRAIRTSVSRITTRKIQRGKKFHFGQAFNFNNDHGEGTQRVPSPFQLGVDSSMSYKPARIVFILITATFLLGGCSKTSKVTTMAELKTNNSTSQQHTSHSQFYMSLRLTEPSAVSDINNTFRPKGSDFSPNLEIKNGLPETNTYLITFFDNGRQIPVRYEGRSVTTINLNVQPWSSSKFSVNMSNLKPGVHNIDCVAFRQPFSTSNTFEPPQKTFVPRRIVVTIGSANGTNIAEKAANISQNVNAPKTAMNLPYFTKQPMGVLADAVSSTNGGKLYLTSARSNPVSITR